MAVGLYTDTRNYLASAIGNLVDAEQSSGAIKIYTANFGTLLAKIDFQDPSFGAPSNGTITAATPLTNETSALATGTAAAFRFEDSSANPILSGTVGTDSSFDLEFNTTSITVGDAVSITSVTVTVPVTSAG